ncbi:MAG: pyruvate synthase [Ruminococcaceae bacterium]|nr:pyruvate synthase [Oscillospiraceae bacterium]
MMKMIEIRWHGRGGQGAKTASLLLADVCFNTGRYVQGFPEYGPERMGAPLTAYNRISDEPIKVHCNIYKPDYVVVVDETLIDVQDVCNGLKTDGGLIVNTRTGPDDIRKKISSFKGKIYTIDAMTISLDCMGKYFPNTPLLSAVVKATGLIDEEIFVRDMEKLYSKKFASNPNVIEGNMSALKRALKEVKGLE